MKRNFLFSLLFLVSFCFYTIEAKTDLTGVKPPPLILKKVLNSATGNVSLDDLRGRVVLLEFWATW